MIYTKKFPDNTSMENIPVNSFARYMRVSPSYISRIKNNKVILSEKMYEKIISLLTEFRNNDRIVSK
jgi:transcriptional regulator with XRE-family HTH domain